MAKKLQRTAKGGYYQNMPSPKYWKQRAKETLAEVFKHESEVETAINETFKRCLISFINDYEKAVSPFEVEGEIDIAKLQRALRTDEKLAAQLTRLFKEIGWMETELNKRGQELVTASLLETYKTTKTAIYSSLGKDIGLEIFNKRAILTAIRTPFTKDGREFSDRIWDNLHLMESNLRQTLSDSIARGESIDKTTRKFKKIFGNTTYNTQRIIRTETIATYTKSSIESYKELGLEQLEVLTEADACEDCAVHDGDIVDVYEAEIGVNVPVFHPNCKCCVAPYIRW